jgi:hypothetical protein
VPSRVPDFEGLRRRRTGNAAQLSRITYTTIGDIAAGLQTAK